uniref:5'-nucleotidase n=1 Tax=Timema douglasi TaxID=61478 RepID=A0A7R8VQP8_TIMDO|nr:unnamed protein product [Timema douglasi]
MGTCPIKLTLVTMGIILLSRKIHEYEPVIEPGTTSQHQRSHGATVALPSAQRLNLAQGAQCKSRKAGVSSLYLVCALSLGNHEFDDGVSGLIPFLNNVTCPVLASNLDLSEEPLLAATPLANSTILVVNGTRIGVIGYLTPDTKELSKSEKVKYIDEVEAIKLEADKLKNQGINILIALGHSGFRKDIQIATEVPDIDVVIGGHTNTFLYTGNQPDLEVPESLYPHVVTQSSGRKVPVVQAYAYTKYLGQLDLVFDEHGEIISYKGNPILLDSSVTREQDILDELEYWRTDVEALQNTVVGRTKVLLDGDRKSCRLVECNMGNLITDAMIDENVLDYTGSGWTDAPIAIQHGGGIRNSIENTANSGTVTRADILEVLPFENAVQKVDLKGDAVLEMLEHSVKNYDLSEAVGGFLQFSGLYVTYDVTKESGKRVVSAMARCGDCRVPTYSPVQTNQTYSILMPSFLVDGGDGFTVFKEKAIKIITLATSDVDIVANYFNRKSPVYTALQGRIKFGIEAKDPGSSASASSSCLVLLFLCWVTATVYS